VTLDGAIERLGLERSCDGASAHDLVDDIVVTRINHAGHHYLKGINGQLAYCNERSGDPRSRPRIAWPDFEGICDDG
jgi:hypothetical protein